MPLLKDLKSRTTHQKEYAAESSIMTRMVYMSIVAKRNTIKANTETKRSEHHDSN